MEGWTKIAAIAVVVLSTLHFLKLALALARLGLTEYSGGADFIRRSLGPMFGSAAISTAGASFIAFPSWTTNLSGIAATYFPPETMAAMSQFGPLLALGVGVMVVLSVLRTA